MTTPLFVCRRLTKDFRQISFLTTSFHSNSAYDSILSPSRSPPASLQSSVHSPHSSHSPHSLPLWQRHRQKNVVIQRRTFLSLPTLPSLPFGNGNNNDNGSSSNGSPSDERQEFQQRKRLNYSPAHVQRVIADVDSYSQFVPWCVESRVTKRHDGGDLRFDAELAVGFKMFVERYMSRVVVVPGVSVTAESNNTGVFQHLKTHWEFQSVDNNPNATFVSFHITFEFKSKIYKTASAHFLDEVVTEMVGAFEKRCAWVAKNTSKKEGGDRSCSIKLDLDVVVDDTITPTTTTTTTTTSSHEREKRKSEKNSQFSTSELDAVRSKFNDIVAANDGSNLMELPQFKKMYYDLFVHSSSETIEDEKQSEAVAAAAAAAAAAAVTATTTATATAAPSTLNVKTKRKQWTFVDPKKEHKDPKKDQKEQKEQKKEKKETALVIKMGELMTRTVTEEDLSILAERHFQVMDSDNSGTLDLDEFVAGMGILLHGTIEEQWSYSFNIFDTDNDGYITRDDLIDMFNATSTVQIKMLIEILKYTRDQLILENHQHVAKQFQIDIDALETEEKSSSNNQGMNESSRQRTIEKLVDDIFHEVDMDNDNQINFEEFCHSEILRSEVERLFAQKISFFEHP